MLWHLVVVGKAARSPLPASKLWADPCFYVGPQKCRLIANTDDGCGNPLPTTTSTSTRHARGLTLLHAIEGNAYCAQPDMRAINLSYKEYYLLIDVVYDHHKTWLATSV
jgi:hypothetical protein